MEQNQGINLSKVFALIRKYGWLCITLILLAGIAGFLISKFLLTPVYQSDLLLIVNYSDTTSALVTYDDVTLSRKLVDTYAVILKDQALSEKIIEQLHLPMDASSLADKISIRTVGSTEILNLTVTDTDPERAAAIANAIVELAPDEIERTVKAGSVAVLSPARTNRTPVLPNIGKNVAVSLLSGLLFSCLIVFLIKKINNKFKTADDITEKLGYTVIGVIPRLHRLLDRPDQGRRNPDTSILMNSKLPFEFVEAYHALRTNLEFLAHDKSVRKILVTSSVAGEGKTTLAANMAVSLGRLGYKVLLMDMDLRKPKIHTIFGLEQSKLMGVSLVLSGKIPAANSIVYAEKYAVSVMPAGPVPPNPNELIQSNALKSTIHDLEGAYDFILFDTPPVSAVPDALALVSSADAVVFVVRQNYTTFETAANVKSSLALVNADVLGCVLNAYDAHTADEYNSYHYYSDGRYRADRK